jgi:protein-disulfide isomerase
LPSTQNAEFTIVDFWDEWVKDYMTENGIKFLPAFIFSTNNFDVSKDRWGLEYKINYYLTALPSGEYTLAIWAVYDSFVERSDRGFRLLTQEQYDLIKAQGSYIEGNKNAKITWLEYSDLQCPYSTLLYTTWTLEAVKAKYWEDINIRFNHFPLNFHPNAEPAAEIAECLWTQKWVTAFYSLVETAFANNTIMNWSDSSAARKLLIDEAVKLWANETTLTACVDAKTYSQKIADQMNSGSDIFWITWTPWNVFINNETLEYEILSWAYPISYFEDIIDKLLK